MRRVLVEKYQKPEKEREGGLVWKNKFGEMHRRNGLPAYSSFFMEIWAVNGKYHRVGDKPAVIRSNVFNWLNNLSVFPMPLEEYWVNGILHRDGDKPAVIYGKNGLLIWYKNGEIHRDEDKPAVVDKFRKNKIWYKNGIIHRDGDKPAETRGPYEFYYENGEVQRRKTNYVKMAKIILLNKHFKLAALAVMYAIFYILLLIM
jgi:hypothetical protein